MKESLKAQRRMDAKQAIRQHFERFADKIGIEIPRVTVEMSTTEGLDLLLLEQCAACLGPALQIIAKSAGVATKSKKSG